MAGIVLGGLLVRVAMTQTVGAREAETWEYEVIARNLLAGRGYGINHLGTWYRTYGGPPFPYLCALLYAVFGLHRVVVLIAQWIFSAVIAVAGYLIGSRLFSTGVGVTAAALVAFHPGILFYDTHKLHPLTFDAALIVWSVGALLWVSSDFSWQATAGLGVLHGLALLERTTLFALPVVALAWLLVVLPPRRRRVAAWYVVGFALVLSPWLARSVSIYGYPVISTTGAELLWRGNNPLADGGSFAAGHPGVPVIDVAPKELRERIATADEVGQERLFMAAAREFIIAQPGAAIRLFLRKLLGFWWFMPQSGALYPSLYLRLYEAYYLVVAVLAVVGCAVALWVSARPVKWQALTILGLMFSISLVHAVFYVEIRHRWGVEPLMLVFTARGCVALLGPTKWATAR